MIASGIRVLVRLIQNSEYVPGCVGLSSTPFTLHETPILHCLEVLRPKTYSNPALSLLHYRPVWCVRVNPLLSKVLLAAWGVLIICALMMLCGGGLVYRSWDSLGCSSVCCDALAQGLKNARACSAVGWCGGVSSSTLFG